ncbi:MAG: trans-sulfuration enzyme family protein [Candidatus Kariarchaeaceae archaeon]|jgi:cystathionine gamma-lyase
MSEDYNFETRAVHAGQEPDEETGAVIPPIHMASTFKQDAIGKHRGFEYSRTNNPTRERLEKQVASLEQAAYGIAFSSGSAATATTQQLLNKGDHVIVGDDVYGGTFRYFDKVMKRFGVEYDFVDLSTTDNLQNHIKDNTKMVWLETPTNPLLKISDLAQISELCLEHDLISAVDNTFATPVLQNPIDYGIDLVVHSSTKYLGGHSDLVGGIIVTSIEEYADQLRFLQNANGAVPSPFDCWLLSRGIKTLPLRMERHCDNAKKIAIFLEDHEKVRKVYYPHLEFHPNYHIAKEQMKLGGGIVSFELSSFEETEFFLNELELFYLAESLGGVESLAEYPATMTHGSIDRNRRIEIGINDGLIRLSVGIESVNDLLDDITRGLDQV